MLNMKSFGVVLVLFYAIVGLVAMLSTIRLHVLTETEGSGDASLVLDGPRADVSTKQKPTGLGVNDLRPDSPNVRSTSNLNSKGAPTPADLVVSPITTKSQSPRERAISAYQAKVEATAKNSCTRQNRSVDLTVALSCLNLTTSALYLEYPLDAEQHFREIRLALAPWAQHNAHIVHTAAKYSGPWMENYWISHFEGLFDEQAANGSSFACLSDIFGPFIPLFVPWVDHWVTNKHTYPSELVETLRSVLRPNVPYITVSQNDDGLPGRHPNLTMEELPNILVMSAGGYGHVPIPLLKQPEPINNHKPVQNRSLLVSYVGSLRNAPNGMRRKVHEKLEKLLTTNETARYQHYYGSDWQKVMADSRFSLAPRGFGRTSYHVMETLQSGLIPVQVYLDIPWVPYADLFDTIGFTAKADEIDDLVDRLETISEDAIRRREQKIVSLRRSHFTAEGVLQQIGRFLLQGELGSDLRCQALPRSVRYA
jgi:hypothetical protein